MKNIHHTITFHEDQIDQLVDTLYPLVALAAIVTLTGSLGAGKTTLAGKLLRRCGVEGGVTSPTFTYMNVYHNKAGHLFYHFDLYRIQSCDDFIAAGFDEYLYKENSTVFIEWPEPIMPLLHKDVCMISLEYVDQDTRTCTYSFSSIR